MASERRRATDETDRTDFLITPFTRADEWPLGNFGFIGFIGFGDTAARRQTGAAPCSQRHIRRGGNQRKSKRGLIGAIVSNAITMAGPPDTIVLNIQRGDRK